MFLFLHRDFKRKVWDKLILKWNITETSIIWAILFKLLLRLVHTKNDNYKEKDIVVKIVLNIKE